MIYCFFLFSGMNYSVNLGVKLANWFVNLEILYFPCTKNISLFLGHKAVSLSLCALPKGVQRSRTTRWAGQSWAASKPDRTCPRGRGHPPECFYLLKYNLCFLVWEGINASGDVWRAKCPKTLVKNNRGEGQPLGVFFYLALWINLLIKAQV